MPWRDYFPTLIERFLWRFSAVYTGGAGFLYVLAIVVKMGFKAISNWVARSNLFNRDSRGCCFDCIKTALFDLCMINVVIVLSVSFCAVFLYIFSRIFLVVEAFISLREQPVTIYQTPKWTRFLGHFQ
jgi:hypothetical protein